MNIKFKETYIDGTAVKFYFANCLNIGELIWTKKTHIYLGNILKLLANKLEVLLPSYNDSYFIFKWFCNGFLHKLILKLAFLDLGRAHV